MHYEYYRSKKNSQWYWRLKASNGKTIADGSEGYKNKADCLGGIDLVKRSANAKEAEIDN